MSFFSKSSTPIYIAGPCSVESEAQLYEIAMAFKSMPIQFMRAGVWKPRTRPGSFEGLGEQALQWLSEIKNEFQKKAIFRWQFRVGRFGRRCLQTVCRIQFPGNDGHCKI